MAKLVDALALGACGETLGGSSPLPGTKLYERKTYKNLNPKNIPVRNVLKIKITLAQIAIKTWSRPLVGF